MVQRALMEICTLSSAFCLVYVYAVNMMQFVITHLSNQSTTVISKVQLQCRPGTW